MAAIIERTARDDITDARRALDDTARLLRDVAAHLDAAERQIMPEPGTLAQAARVAASVAATFADVQARIRDASRAATLPD